jgi:hypothetical protein
MLFKALGIELSFRTKLCPRTLNLMAKLSLGINLQRYVDDYVSSRQSSWEKYFHLVEFVHNKMSMF